MAIFTAGGYGVDFDQLELGSLLLASPTNVTPTSFVIQVGGQADTFFGSGLTYGANAYPSGGVISQIQETYFGQPVFTLSGMATPAFSFVNWGASGGDTLAKLTILGGADQIAGSENTDRLRGYGGDDTINAAGGADFVDGGDGNDMVHGGTGDDVIVDAGGTNYLRGDEGNDQITGGAGFDDANGNQGNDTISTGAGDDYSVGGKDNDLLFGDGGNDIVWGNLGDDTCNGGDGNDQVRGGQGADIVNGGAGDDFVSGDRGDDTITGGTGADIFHGSQDAGIDRVLDFHLAEGDRVQLDPGTTYTLKQVGADTVIDMGGANQMILVGVQLSTLTPGWIFGA